MAFQNGKRRQDVLEIRTCRRTVSYKGIVSWMLTDVNSELKAQAVAYCGQAFEFDSTIARNPAASHSRRWNASRALRRCLIRGNKTRIELRETISPVVFDDDRLQDLIRLCEEFERAPATLVLTVDGSR